jgi:hypothetical protein
MAEAPLVVYHADPAQAALVAKEYRLAITAAIVERISEVAPGHVIRWAKTLCFPTLADWTQFRTGALQAGGMERVSVTGRKWLFLDDSAKTEAEKAGGRLPGISRAAGGPAGIFSVGELRVLFDSQILPSQLEASTRKSYWGTWQLVLTWGLAHGIMDKILPMSAEDFRALVMEMMMVGLGAASIKNIMSAVQTRHRLAGLTPPLMESRAFARMYKAVASVKGTPSRLRFPVGTHHLLQMIALEGRMSPLERRAVLVTCVGTACVSRVDEMAQIQMCDLLWGHDGPYHPSLAAALAIRIIRRKQDTGRFGLYVRIPAGLLVEMLRAYVRDMRLRLDPRCTKAAQRGATCPFCDPVWPKTVAGRRRESAGPILGMSRQQVSGAVKVALESLGVDARHYSGISMRRGGVTAAVQAKIHPALMHLQSGHGTATSSMGYVDPVDPAALYHTAAAILGMRP